MTEQVLKYLVFNNQVRLYLVDNSNTVQQLTEQSEIKDTFVKKAFAQTLSIVGLISATLKGEQRLSLTISLNQSKGKFLVDTNASGEIRGYVSDLLATKQGVSSLKQLQGERSSIRMIKGSQMNQFTGITDMPYETIDENMSHYFKQSEQIDTLFHTEVYLDDEQKVEESYALYAQLLPGASAGLLNEVKNWVKSEPQMLKTIMDRSNVEKHNLGLFFKDIERIGEQTIRAFCRCSKEMFYGLLYSIETKERMDIINQNESIEMSCHSCGRIYRFTADELKNL